MRPLLTLALMLAFSCCSAAQERLPTVITEGGLKILADGQGNRMPDYSYCGYMASEQPLPDVATKLRISPSGQDDTLRIKAALEQLAGMPTDKDGWHGALELAAGEFKVEGSIALPTSGIVLRGSRDQQGKVLTTILATGQSRRALVVVGKVGQPANGQVETNQFKLSATALIGSKRIEFQPVGQWPDGLDSVSIEVQSTKEWIDALGMNRFPADDGRGSWLDWKPSSLNQVIKRNIVHRGPNWIEVDAPLTGSLDPKLVQILVTQSKAKDVIHHIGIEHLNLISQVDRENNAKDEEHAWDGVRVLSARDVWVRNVECRHFAGSAVRVQRQAQRVTVVDCRSKDPVSEDAGWRRRSFVTSGQQTLFLRCQAENGRHDFCTESLAVGPNAFVRCQAVRASGCSGPIGSWCTGVLYDNVEIDGSSLELNNFETEGQGIGWAAANCTLWNCVAPKLVVRRPPTAYNWAIGVWGEVTGDGLWHHLNEFVSPDSLYEHQLAQRIGKDKAQNVLRADSKSWDSTSDTARLFDRITKTDAPTKTQRALNIKEGRLRVGEQPISGTRMRLSWWRGSMLPSKVAEFGPGLTRFAPGYDERFYTDDLQHVAEQMQSSGHVAVDHHWGLWYDRRRDDHQMIRRIDGEAWPPFYEMPWARSGIGTGFDGLSKYDLTRFNPWYFNRLKEFAGLADQRGLVLVEHMYFQHNILEAGAHWSEFPWRPANCLQATGFPEPPVYQNRKRVFMADDFYDVTHPVRRDLHTRYIRHCLDELSPYSNVMFVLGEEFTGPAHFVRFWLETIDAWQRETGRDVLVVLSTTRDVQEETLSDPKLRDLIDVIEIRYWWHTKEGVLYDPPGGQNLAPRQQLREWPGPKSYSAESLARSVQDLRNRFPSKAILTNLPSVSSLNP